MSAELSYTSKPRKSPIIYKTIIDVFREDVASTPDKECIIYRGLDGTRESLTYIQLHTKATVLAKVLVTKGVKKGDKVALSGPNTLEKVVGEFAIILAGGIVVHLTMTLTDQRDVLEIFNVAGCSLLLVEPGKDQSNLDPMLRLLDLFSKKNLSYDNKRETLDPPILFLRSMKNIPTHLDISAIGDVDRNVDLPKIYPEELVLVFTTSGSTGKPKMVAHSHFNFINFGTDDIILGSKSQNGGMKVYNDRPFSYLGGSLCFFISYHMPRVFVDPSAVSKGHCTLDIWKIIKEEKCQVAVLPPYILSELIQNKDEYTDPFKLDAIITGGQVIDKYYAQVIGIFTKSVMVGFGSTEVPCATFHQSINSKGSQTIESYPPAEGVEVKVVDDKGNVTGRCEPGEICFRSTCMFNCYYKDEKLTKESFLDGNWFRTGDTGYLTKEGRIVVQGRLKDIISRGTRKIFPAALEDVIKEMEGLAQVSVVPVPDKRLYEEVCVCFTAQGDKKIEEKDVQEFCEKRFSVELSADGFGERPKYYVKFESLPKLASGKFDKGKIRTEAIDRLNIKS